MAVLHFSVIFSLFNYSLSSTLFKWPTERCSSHTSSTSRLILRIFTKQHNSHFLNHQWKLSNVPQGKFILLEIPPLNNRSLEIRYLTLWTLKYESLIICNFLNLENHFPCKLSSVSTTVQLFTLIIEFPLKYNEFSNFH